MCASTWHCTWTILYHYMAHCKLQITSSKTTQRHLWLSSPMYSLCLMYTVMQLHPQNNQNFMIYRNLYFATVDHVWQCTYNNVYIPDWANPHSKEGKKWGYDNYYSLWKESLLRTLERRMLAAWPCSMLSLFSWSGSYWKSEMSR